MYDGLTELQDENTVHKGRLKMESLLVKLKTKLSSRL